MTLQELESQILALPLTEKAAIIQRLTQTVNIGLMLGCIQMHISREIEAAIHGNEVP